jgi:hypothetical protein
LNGPIFLDLVLLFKLSKKEIKGIIYCLTTFFNEYFPLQNQIHNLLQCLILPFLYVLLWWEFINFWFSLMFCLMKIVVEGFLCWMLVSPTYHFFAWKTHLNSWWFNPSLPNLHELGGVSFIHVKGIPLLFLKSNKKKKKVS